MDKSVKKWLKVEAGFPKTWAVTMLFSGHTYRSLDAKGRLVLPASIRDVLLDSSPDGRFVLTTYDGCIVGFPEPEWRIFAEKFGRIPNPSRQMRDFRRLVLGGAEVMEPDHLGRVRIPRGQMEYAGIEREVVIVGQATRFEIWAQEAFKALIAQDFNDVTNELAASGIELGL